MNLKISLLTKGYNSISKMKYLNLFDCEEIIWIKYWYLIPYNSVQSIHINVIIIIIIIIIMSGGARGVVVIAVGNEHGDTSSNPGRDWLHFT